MNLYAFFILLLFAESVVFVFILTLILLKRYIIYFKNIKHAKNQKTIASFLMQCINHSEKALPEELPYHQRVFEDLIIELEAFDFRFKDAAWKILKMKIATYYLLPKAKKMANSLFWVKRQLAARCFAIVPQKNNEPLLLKLLADPIFLVRASAAVAAIGLESKKAILALVKKMSVSSGYERSYYRDLLLQATREVFVIVEEIARKERNTLIHIAAMEVLSYQISSLTLEEIKKDLLSKNQKIRLLALKTISHNPKKGFEKILVQYLKSKNPEERAEAACGHGNFLSPATLKALTKTLQDTPWKSRFNAAKSLKNLGEEGIEILKMQTAEKNINAYEAAHYVLQFS